MDNSVKKILKISFLGGTQEITGSNFIFEYGKRKFLIDCGLFQGSKIVEDKNGDPFLFNPSDIEAVFVTHGHLDHVGRIPKLFKDGFDGKVFSTPATRDLADLVMNDNLDLMKRESRKNNNNDQIYRKEDIEKSMNQWESVDYNKSLVFDDMTVILKDAGHILGSSMIEIKNNDIKIVFTGDLGNPPNPILRDAEKITDANFLVIESVYGDRKHEDIENANLKIERVIEDTIHAEGVLMIPSFSIERTQKLLFEIDNLVENGRIPKVPVFLDSPMAIDATRIYKKYQAYYNNNAKKIIKLGDDIFNFPGLKITRTAEESKAINEIPAPKIIIAGSGMCNGGRIIHHLHRYLSDPKSTLLFMGYQSSGSMGRRLQEGAKEVKILGDYISVRSKIEILHGYSAHSDMNDLYNFVQNTADTLKKVFVVQGEPRSSMFFAQRLRDYMGVDAVVPKAGDSFELKL
ncbi:MAG: MBL fold metallo-hydrolase [Patescibacteria group bacterium]